MKIETDNMISAAALSRALGLTQKQAARFRKLGLLQPDKVVYGRFQYFNINRLPNIEQAILEKITV